MVSKSGNADDTSGCFNDYDVLAPLRFLLRKQKDPERYKQMKNLVGHIETKVIKELANQDSGLFQLWPRTPLIIETRTRLVKDFRNS